MCILLSHNACAYDLCLCQFLELVSLRRANVYRSFAVFTQRDSHRIDTWYEACCSSHAVHAAQVAIVVVLLQLHSLLLSLRCDHLTCNALNCVASRCNVDRLRVTFTSILTSVS